MNIRPVPTCNLVLILLLISAMTTMAKLPKCDHSQSIRVGSTTIEICSWNKAEAPGVGLLQIAAVSNDRMIDVATFEIFGTITDVGVTDLDQDNDPEIHVIVESPDSGHYPELYLLELTEGELDRYALPEMTALQANGYMGHDTFTFEENRLVREFPIYDSNKTDADPTDGTRRITYVMSERHLIFQSRADISPEPADSSIKK